MLFNSVKSDFLSKLQVAIIGTAVFHISFIFHPWKLLLDSDFTVKGPLCLRTSSHTKLAQFQPEQITMVT